MKSFSRVVFVVIPVDVLEGGDVLIGDAGANGLVAFDALFDVGGGEFAADVEQVREPNTTAIIHWKT